VPKWFPGIEKAMEELEDGASREVLAERLGCAPKDAAYRLATLDKDAWESTPFYKAKTKKALSEQRRKTAG